MKLSTRWELASAIGAALVVMVALPGPEALAERLWTERPAELRSSPGDDAQVVKRVSKGRSLEVVRRLGTWVQVEYEGRTGWIRRTALSTEPVSGGSSAADDNKEDRKSRDRVVEAEPEDDAGTKAADAGAKKTAARKKAERQKSRDSRRGTVREQRDEEEDDVTAGDKRRPKASAENQDEGEDSKPRRPRSTWAARGRLPGGPLKVEIQALSAQAFSEPDGSGTVVFTVTEGDQVRVIGRGENRWLLVENAKKRQGWIPAVAVRDHGLLLEARKTGGDEADEEGAREVRNPAEQEVKEIRKRTTARARAAVSDRDSDELDEEFADEDEDDEADTGSDDGDATLGGSALRGEPTSDRKGWNATASLLGGFTAAGLDRTPTGSGEQTASYNGPTAGLSGELMYHWSRKLALVGDLDYTFAYPLGGLTYSAGGAEQTGIALQNHRIEAKVGAAYGRRAMVIVRAGYSYETLLLSDLDNPANLPRESTSGPTLGVGSSYRFANGLSARVGLDALVFGSRTQTEGSRDGTELDSLLGLTGTAQADWPIGKSLTLVGGYRFGYTTASWVGTSERTPGATATDQTDQSHELTVGVGFRL